MTHSGLSKVLTVLIAGTLGGLLLGLAAVPAMALYGFGLGAIAAPYDEMSGDLPTPPAAQRSVLYANDGRTALTTFYQEDRTDVPLSAVAPVMRQAMVAAEDTRFYAHHGVDLRGVLRAFVVNRLGGEARQGASTLTMQYVRNVRKSDPSLTDAERAAATETTVGRKLQEMRYALALERKLSKNEILSRYLNIAYFGSGAYGISAASHRYFNKPAAALTLAESALLAGLVRAPEYYDPINGNARAAVGRRGYVLDQMVGMGVLSADTAARAQAERLVLRPRNTSGDCAAVPAQHADWGFFCDYFRQWWSNQPAFGATPAERLDALRRGGYRITTTLDPNIQATALRYAQWVYPDNSPRALPTAVVQPGTGHVLALAVNRRYGVGGNPNGRENYPNTVNQLVAGGGDIEGYQAGSTFKLFTMLAALEAGMPLSTGFDAPSRLQTGYPSDGPASCGGYWCPGNANPEWMDGYRTMWTGFGRSVNTYFAYLIERVGADRAVEMAQRLGIRFRAESDARLARTGARAWGPFTLGVVSTTPLDLANAYATVAAEGVYCEPLPVSSIIDAGGRSVAAAEPSCKRVLSAEVARAATDAARCPVGDQSAYGRCDGGTGLQVHEVLKGRPVAGKTGSSEDYATETAVAYTPQVAVAAIAANPDNPRDLVGSEVQAQVVVAVARTMEEALKGKPVLKFTPPGLGPAFGLAPGRPGLAPN
jgi:membrane peptidoglycan carboxypeptidase